ncbi:MAG: hypothetical protein ABIY50_02445, partial [Ignavibacteria bacterium]
MKQFIVLIFIITAGICFSNVKVSAQPIVWKKIFGGQYNEVAYNCIESRDGGYLVSGFKEVLFKGGPFTIWQAYLVKLDRYGNILWDKIIGDSSALGISPTVIEDPLGNIFFPYTEEVGHLAKLDSKGNLLWNKDYALNNIELFRGISFENNYRNLVLLSQNIVQGFYSTSSITKLDTSGNVIWNKSIYDSIPSISVYTSHNNSFIFLPNSYYITGAKGVNAFIIKTDTNGNVIWNKRYFDNRGIFSIAQISENFFIGSGQADAAGNLFCQKFDSGGVVIWNKNYGNDPLAFGVGYDRIIKNFDNHFALGTTGGNKGRLLVIDSLGSILTSKFYPFPQNYLVKQKNINNTSDSGYIISGSIDSNNSISIPRIGDKQIDVLIFKIDKNGNTVSIGKFSSLV